MKKMFFICCIAVSALALGTSANTNHYRFSSVSNADTTPPMMMDSMHHGAMKMHHKRMMKDSTSGMSMSTDSTRTAPPKQ